MRHRNNPLHQKLMLLGFVLTLGIAVVLVVGVYGFDATYGPAAWLVSATGSEAGARIVLITHRAVATITLVVLILQIITGLRRHPLHHRLFKAVVPLWLLTYVSGLTIFV
jgi:uncharacterized membrane protein YozB (DUF420 family)